MRISNLRRKYLKLTLTEPSAISCSAKRNVLFKIFKAIFHINPSTLKYIFLPEDYYSLSVLQKMPLKHIVTVLISIKTVHMRLYSPNNHGTSQMLFVT
jgi:hypothetical protein